MGLLKQDHFICLDCETTGLSFETDEIIEFAAVKFTFKEKIAALETLVSPSITIPQESIDIHHITNEMVENSPPISEVYESFIEFAGDLPIVGHNISFDITMLQKAAERLKKPKPLVKNIQIDTLRLARLYAESPVNSLDALRRHFNIEEQGAHRAMNDVVVNIDVFKRLTTKFITTEEIIKRLKKPIALKFMPLGKYKGRTFEEIPMNYLHWAKNQDFDQDLIFSLEQQCRKRKKKQSFLAANNPFKDL